LGWLVRLETAGIPENPRASADCITDPPFTTFPSL
jgi:hypothetical protein